jgi:hypothetical protein
MSRACWATTFLSRAFSCSRRESSAACRGSKPPYFLRQRNRVVTVIPCFFATWATVTSGASLSLTTATICSSLYRLLRIRDPPLGGGSCHNPWS